MRCFALKDNLTTTCFVSELWLHHLFCQRIMTPPLVSSANYDSTTCFVSELWLHHLFCQRIMTPPLVLSANCDSTTCFVSELWLHHLFCQRIMTPPLLLSANCDYWHKPATVHFQIVLLFYMHFFFTRINNLQNCVVTHNKLFLRRFHFRFSAYSI